MRRSREARSDTLHPLEPAGDRRWIPSTSERDEHAPKPLSRFRSGARTLLRWPLAGPFTMLAAWSVVLFVGAIFGILATHLALTPYAVLSLFALGMVDALAIYLALAATLDRVEVEIGEGQVRIRPVPLSLPGLFPPRTLPLAALTEVRIHEDDVVVVAARARAWALPRAANAQVAQAISADLTSHLPSEPEAGDAPPPRPWVAVFLRALGGLAAVAFGVGLMLAGNGDYRHAMFAEGNGPLLPLWFIGPFVIVLGLGLASASGARGRYLERVLSHAFAWFGLLSTLIGVLLIVSLYFLCFGVFFAPLGIFVLVRAVLQIAALGAADE